MHKLYPSHGPEALVPVLGKSAKEIRLVASRAGLKVDAQVRARLTYSRGLVGRRADIGIYVRSRWEANYARYLNWLVGTGRVRSWEYEKHTFWFEKIRRGVRSYKPDFRVEFSDGRVEWHEVKGWMDQKSRTRLRRMQKYYPREVVVVLDQHWFRNAVVQGMDRIIPNWESARAR